MGQNQRKNRKKMWVACGLGVGLGAFAIFNNLPHSSHAAGGGPLAEFVLYGISSQSGSLVRYQFSDGTRSIIGPIRNGAGTLTGIQASAYVPRNSNIFAFWNDPSDGQTKLVYINATTGNATIVGQPLGPEIVTAAVAVKPTATAPLASNQATPIGDIQQYKLFATQKIPIELEFSTYNLRVVVGDTFSILDYVENPKGMTLGADFYFAYEDAETWHIADFNANTPITIVAADLKGGNKATGDYRFTLFDMDGNELDTITIQTNSTGISDVTASAGLIDGDSDGDSDGASDGDSDGDGDRDGDDDSHLIEIDPVTGVVTELMKLDRVYDGLAATTSQVFYGTAGRELYALDPSAGTETLIGTLPYSQDVESFEAAGNQFFGFAGTANQLRQIDPATGKIIGADINTGITDLESLTLIRLADEPKEKRQFD